MFNEKIIARNREVGNHLCVGIDPSGHDLSPFFEAELKKMGAEEFLLKISRTIFSAAKGASALKFQSAFYEAYGAMGVRALELLTREAKQSGFVTILDAKRGDISSTMKAYGVAAFDRIGADALTVTAYMGTDVLDPLKEWGAIGFGVYVVWISSNPSGRQLQDTECADGSGTVAEKMQRDIDAWEIESKLNGMTGYVLGATKLQSSLVEKVNKKERFFLMPGVGAQGGKIDYSLKSILKKHPGTLVAMSRSLTGLGAGKSLEWVGIDSWNLYESAVAKACQTAISQLLIE